MAGPAKRSGLGDHLKAVGVLAVLVLIGFGLYAYRTYGTLEPCAMLQEEVKIRLLNGELATLGEIPALVANSGDQVWCAREFVTLQLP